MNECLKNKFYLACFRDNVGSNVSFHGNGYTSNVNDARVYDLEEAQKAWDGARSYDQPISAFEISKLLVSKVDHQYMPSASVNGKNGEKYYVFKKGKWDGNDVFWLTSPNDSTGNVDLNLAFEFDKKELDFNFNVTYMPTHIAQKEMRNTFAFEQYNARKMVQAYGLRVPKHIKIGRARKKARIKQTGKTKINCPSCGRMNWQYHTHDFDGCHNHKCEEYKFKSP